jgi:hypothetical protein
LFFNGNFLFASLFSILCGLPPLFFKREGVGG